MIEIIGQITSIVATGLPRRRIPAPGIIARTRSGSIERVRRTTTKSRTKINLS
jgi:hypothetical protein